MTRALLDVNLLLALFDPAHVQHVRAHRWWRLNQQYGWASCPLTQNGFIRILSQPRYPSPLSTTAALRLLNQAVESPHHEFWPGDLTILDPSLFDSDRILGPRQLTDIYLLGLAVRKGGRLATFDRSLPLSAVIGATPDHIALP